MSERLIRVPSGWTPRRMVKLGGGGTPPPDPTGLLSYSSYPTMVGPRFTPNVNRSGPQVITQPGTYSGWNVTDGGVNINLVTPGPVEFLDFSVAGGGIGIMPSSKSTTTKIRYGKIVGNPNELGAAGLYTRYKPYVTHEYLDISGCEDGANIGNLDHIFRYNWIHDLVAPPQGHNDGIQMLGGGGANSGGGTDVNTEIGWNRIDGPWQQQTSAILLKADFGHINDVRVHHNWLLGGSMTLYVYDVPEYNQLTSNVKLISNRFGRNSYLYGYFARNPTTPRSGQITEMTDNRWSDDLTLVAGLN